MVREKKLLIRKFLKVCGIGGQKEGTDGRREVNKEYLSSHFFYVLGIFPEKKKDINFFIWLIIQTH